MDSPGIGTAIAPLDLVRANALKAISAVEAGIAELNAKYKDVVFDCKTTSGMADAKVARAAVRDPRYQVERSRKEKKSELAEIGREVDRKAAEVTEALEALENPIHAQITAEEKRKEDEKIKKAEDERRRTGAIRAMIDAIRNTEPARNVSSVEIAIMNLSVIEISTEAFHEFVDEALAVRESTIERLKAILVELMEVERQREELREQAEQQRLAAEKLAEERRKLDEERAEQDRIRLERQALEDQERAKRQAEEDLVRETARRKQQYLDNLQRLVVMASTAKSEWIENTLATMEQRSGCEEALQEAQRSLQTILVAARKIEQAQEAEAARKAAEQAEADRQKAAAEAERVRIAKEQADREEQIRLDQATLASQQQAFADQQAKEAQAKIEAEQATKAKESTVEEKLAALQLAVETYIRSDMMNVEVRRAGLVALRAALTFSRGGK